jgi:hypothetical protein
MVGYCSTMKSAEDASVREVGQVATNGLVGDSEQIAEFRATDAPSLTDKRGYASLSLQNRPSGRSTNHYIASEGIPTL